MIVQCAQCQTRFRIPDEKVNEKGVKVRCTRCQHTFRVNKQGPVDSAPPPPVPPESDPFAAFAAPVGPPSEQATRPGVAADVLAMLRGETTDEPTRLMPADVSARLREATPPPAPLPAPPPAPASRAPVPRPPPVAAPAPAEGGGEALFGAPRTGRETGTHTGIRPPAPGQARPDVFGAPPPSASAAVPPEDPFAFLPPASPAPKPRTDPFGSASSPPAAAPAQEAPPEDPFDALDLAPAAPAPVQASVQVQLDSEPEEEAWPAPSEARAQLFGASLEAPHQALLPAPLTEPIVEIGAGQGNAAVALGRTPLPRQAPLPAEAPVRLAPPPPSEPVPRSVGALLVRALLAALLLALLGAVVLAGLGEGRLSFATLRPGAAGALVPRDVSNGLYDTRAGRPVFYVRGEVENRGASPARIRVRVEIFDGEQRLRTGVGLAGASASPEDLFALASPADGEALRARLDAQAALVAPGARAPFLLTFVEYPPHLARYRFQVSAEPAPTPEG